MLTGLRGQKGQAKAQVALYALVPRRSPAPCSGQRRAVEGFVMLRLGIFRLYRRPLRDASKFLIRIAAISNPKAPRLGKNSQLRRGFSLPAAAINI